MDQFTVIISLILLIFVVVCAIRGKSIINYFNRIKIKLSGVKIPKINEDICNSGKDNPSDTTIIPPLMFMHQLDRKGKSIYTHTIDYKMIYDGDEMVGVTVSHPGAKSDGVLLYGKTKKNGVIDDKDPDTYTALTVNTDAIIIGEDKDGVYGEVYNPHARVYKLSKDKKRVTVPYGATFAIEDGTYICIGNQWLYFAEPDLPVFPGGTDGTDVVKEDIDFDTPPVPAVKSKRGMRKRGNEAVVADEAPEGNPRRKEPHAPTARFDHRETKPEGEKKLSYRFPLDE